MCCSCSHADLRSDRECDGRLIQTGTIATISPNWSRCCSPAGHKPRDAGRRRGGAAGPRSVLESHPQNQGPDGETGPDVGRQPLQSALSNTHQVLQTGNTLTCTTQSSERILSEVRTRSSSSDISWIRTLSWVSSTTQTSGLNWTWTLQTWWSFTKCPCYVLPVESDDITYPDIYIYIIYRTVV